MSLIGVTSDWHLGGGGAADDSNEGGLYWIIDQMLCFPLSAIVVAGDMAEGLQFSTDAILERRRIFLHWLDATLADLGIALHVVKGNHDPSDWLARLEVAMPRLSARGLFFAHESDVTLCGWRISHGNEWDKWNKFGSPRKWIANAATWIAGIAERVFPGLNENKLNPLTWFSPAKTPSLHTEIHDAADDYAKAHHTRVCYGHTHTWRISADRQVVNCGCCTGSHAEAAILDDQGWAEIIRRDIAKAA